MSILDRLTQKKPDTAASKKKADVSVAKNNESTGDAKNSTRATILGGSILRRPVLSEKAVHQEAHGTYTFVVAKDVNKTMVKKAVQDAYGVMPSAVRVVNMQGKTLRFGRNMGKRSDWKKAIITLPKGKTISVHEGV